MLSDLIRSDLSLILVLKGTNTGIWKKRVDIIMHIICAMGFFLVITILFNLKVEINCHS